MNLRTVPKLIRLLLCFIGVSMSFSLMWSLELGEVRAWGMRISGRPDAAWAIGTSMAVCLGFGGVLAGIGWQSKAPVLRRESLAVVGIGKMI